MAGGRNKGGFGVRLKSLLIRGAASLLILPSSGPTLAQTPAPPPAYEPAPNAAPEAQPPRFTQAELEHLLAPIALYPDALLAQLLPASAYPLEIVQAHRWLERNSAAAANGDFSGADAQNWDPSVKAMVRFPTVLQKLNDDLDWTRNLGDAIVNQPQEVADAIQRLRLKAQQAGALASNDQMTVVTQKEGPREVIVIESPNPSVIYVPRYDPVAVFAPPAGAAIAAGLLSFGVGVAVGSAWRGNYWNWNTGAFFPPVWPGYPGWRGGGNNVTINGGGGNTIIGGGNGGNNVIGGRPWRPDPDRRPGGRPGAGGPIGRPGPGGGNGGVRPPGGGVGGGGPINRPGGGGNGGLRPPGGGVGGGPVNRPGPGGGNGVVRPPGGGAGGGPINRPGGGVGNGALRPPGGGGQVNRPGPGGGAIGRPGGGPGGSIGLPGAGGRPGGGGFPGQAGGFPARPAPGGRPALQGGGAPGHRGMQGRPAHHGFQGGGGGHHRGGGGHGGGGRAHHGGGRRR